MTIRIPRWMFAPLLLLLFLASAQADTVRTVAALQNLLRDGQPASSIVPQTVRDMLVSLALQNGNFSDLHTSPVGLISGEVWVNGTVLNMVP